MVVTMMGGGLWALGFSLEMRIRHDATTFDAADFPLPLFLLRHIVRDQATMGAGARWAHGGGLRGSL